MECAARLLREQGADAVTTRAVAQAAGMQAPTIYRFFEDKDGAARRRRRARLRHLRRGKALAEDGGDPVADLRAGWDTHIDFGLANAALFGLLIDPGRGRRSPAAAAGLEVLRARVQRVAAIGRLRVPEQRAVELIHAAGTGTVLTLLATPPEQRDPGLADAMYEAVMRPILTDIPDASHGRRDRRRRRIPGRRTGADRCSATPSAPCWRSGWTGPATAPPPPVPEPAPASALEAVGYVRIREGHVGERPRLSATGRWAYLAHVFAPQAIIAPSNSASSRGRGRVGSGSDPTRRRARPSRARLLPVADMDHGGSPVRP